MPDDIIEVITDPLSVIQVFAEPVTVVEVVTAGPPGPPGAPAQIVTWFEGEGPPPLAIPGAVPGDMYHDTVDHRFFQLR
jgi:hypothetical protein